MGLMRTILLAGSQSRWLEKLATRSPLTRRAVRRFIPGETLAEALEAAAELERNGMRALLTQLGENVKDRAEAEAVAAHLEEMMERARERGLAAEPSVKPTQLGLDLSEELCAEMLERVAARAGAAGLFLWVDMEGSAYVDATLRLFAALHERHRATGIALQAYLHRTPADLEAMIAMGAPVRLVKGAYSEPASVAITRKRDVRDAYRRVALRLVSGDARRAGVRAVFGTHDIGMLDGIVAEAKAAGVGPDGYEVHMLYGIRTADQRRLVAQGHRVHILISYGSAWFPWYMRRLAERPANLLFLLRGLFSR